MSAFCLLPTLRGGKGVSTHIMLCYMYISYDDQTFKFWKVFQGNLAEIVGSTKYITKFCCDWKEAVIISVTEERLIEPSAKVLVLRRLNTSRVSNCAMIYMYKPSKMYKSENFNICLPSNLFCPRPFHKLWIEHLLPSVKALNICTIREITCYLFPAICSNIIHQFLQFFIL